MRKVGEAAKWFREPLLLLLMLLMRVDGDVDVRPGANACESAANTTRITAAAMAAAGVEGDFMLLSRAVFEMREKQYQCFCDQIILVAHCRPHTIAMPTSTSYRRRSSSIDSGFPIIPRVST